MKAILKKTVRKVIERGVIKVGDMLEQNWASPERMAIGKNGRRFHLFWDTAVEGKSRILKITRFSRGLLSREMNKEAWKEMLDKELSQIEEDAQKKGFHTLRFYLQPRFLKAFVKRGYIFNGSNEKGMIVEKKLVQKSREKNNYFRTGAKEPYPL